MEQPHKKSFFLHQFAHWLRGRFDLNDDKASEDEVRENIIKGIDFKGTNLWVLMFATFIASLGLNINSTAVIIGAMLISPLMGPIMGIGLSVGINDFDLMKRSFRNFGFMVLVSILTSTLYFLISPLSNAQSELLARTVPTTYDVLIAFFGGLAGIVAQSRKDRTSTVIPGVAIATALMPPLCTAGYGIATMQSAFIFGAVYLFFINTVFIAIATYMVVRFMKYRKKKFIDSSREKKVKRSIWIIVILTLIPSIFIAVKLVRQSIFESTADRYVAAVLQFPQAQMIDYSRYLRADGSGCIEVLLIGDPVSEDAIENARMQLANYNLKNVELIVRQPGERDRDNIDLTSLQSSYRELLYEKNRRIYELESRLGNFTSDTLPALDITREMGALSDQLEEVSLTRTYNYTPAGQITDTVVLCLIRAKDGKLDPVDQERIAAWLQARTKTGNIKLFIE